MYLHQDCWSLLAFCMPNCWISLWWCHTIHMCQVISCLSTACAIQDSAACTCVMHLPCQPLISVCHCCLCANSLQLFAGAHTALPASKLTAALSQCSVLADYIPKYKLWTGLVAPMWLVIRFCTWISDVTLVTSQVMKVRHSAAQLLSSNQKLHLLLFMSVIRLLHISSPLHKASVAETSLSQFFGHLN